MKLIKTLLIATRPKTLPAAAVPVFLGGALAQNQGAFQLFPWSICLVFALLVQIGTNFANDVYDYEKGSDRKERIGPTRVVSAGMITPYAMKIAMLSVFLASFLIGLLLVPYGGWSLIAIGLLSLVCAYAYTGGPYPLGYNGLGEFFVFIFFGWIATAFTYFVQSGTFLLESSGSEWFKYSAIWIAGLMPGAFATNLLVINNYRDAPQDVVSGKRTLIVRFGRIFGYWECAFFFAVGLITPIIFFLFTFSGWVLLPSFCLPLIGSILNNLHKANSRPEFAMLLARTAFVLAAGGVLFSVGILLS